MPKHIMSIMFKDSTKDNNGSTISVNPYMERAIEFYLEEEEGGKSETSKCEFFCYQIQI